MKIPNFTSLKTFETIAQLKACVWSIESVQHQKKSLQWMAFICVLTVEISFTESFKVKWINLSLESLFYLIFEITQLVVLYLVVILSTIVTLLAIGEYNKL